MIISFGAVVSILRLGGFLQHTSANVLEDVTDEKDYKSAVALKKYMKEIRSVNPGYRLITHYGRCKHSNGKLLNNCYKAPVHTPRHCEADCTASSSCIGYYYNYASCFLYPSSLSCPNGYTSRFYNNGFYATAITSYDLVADGRGYSGHWCYAKNKVDCQWGSWETGTCTKTCGGGTRTKTRVKTVVESPGGRCTGSFQVIDNCNTNQCPVNCQWASWTMETCTKTCGGGSHTKNRTKIVVEANGGTCAGSSTLSETCNTNKCPDVAPGQPSNFRTSNIGTYEISLSWDAPTEENDDIETYQIFWDDNLKRTQHKRDIGLVTQYTLDGLSSGTTYSISVASKSISGLLSTANSLFATTLDEPVDCAWASWSEWSTCTTTCGNGMKTRARSISIDASNGGNQCCGETEMTSFCNEGACIDENCDDTILQLNNTILQLNDTNLHLKDTVQQCKNTMNNTILQLGDTIQQLRDTNGKLCEMVDCTDSEAKQFCPAACKDDNTCGDTESWCPLLSEFECNEDQVREKCPKSCRQCNEIEGNQNEDNTCGDGEPWCTFISEFECNEDQVRGKCSKACRQCNGGI